MAADTASAVAALNHRFLRDHPREAARELERLPPETAAPALADTPVALLRAVWEYLAPDAAEVLLLRMPEATALALLAELEPGTAAALLDRMDGERRAGYLSAMDQSLAREMQRLLDYPVDSAGRLMDARVMAMAGTTRADQALQRMRRLRPAAARFVYVIDDDSRLRSAVAIQDLALAPEDASLESLAHPLPVALSALDPREEVVAALERFDLEELPVVDVHGRLLGAIHAPALLRTLQEAASTDIQTMVGVSRDERALSPVGFAVRKRLLWMHINLATAFLAASVVGLFESTIAQFTALAVLLPVVAGQSGNAGAQALAVTMRGLALREISIRHWFRVTFKEIRVGALNGLAIALTTAVGVYVWSGSYGLSLVIAVAMVISMTIAGIAGALVPIVLTRLGQDPAQSSSIVLTTVTDVAGFLSFLGIATLLAALLV